MLVFWVLQYVILEVLTNISKDPTASIFKIEVARTVNRMGHSIKTQIKEHHQHIPLYQP
jgi:hypothetical protein